MTLELRESSDGQSWTLTGPATTWTPPSPRYRVSDSRGRYAEGITRGAFRGAVNGTDVVALRIEHNPNAAPLASTSGGSLRFTDEPSGLILRATLPKGETDVRDAVAKVQRGVLKGLSVGMMVDDDDWSADGSSRTIRSARLGEVSLVHQAANPSASVTSVRAADGVYEVRHAGPLYVARAAVPSADVDVDDVAPCVPCGGTGWVAGGRICASCGGVGTVPVDDGDETDESDGRAARAKYTPQQLDAMLISGAAMPNATGKPSYPIKDSDDLRRAIKAVGRGGRDSASIRRHVIRRATALGLTSMLPKNWLADGSVKAGRSGIRPTELRYRAASMRGEYLDAEIRQLSGAGSRWDSEDRLRSTSRAATTARLRGDLWLARRLDMAYESEVLAQSLGL